MNERIQYVDANGKIITDSIKDYTRNNVQKNYRTIDEFLNRWGKAAKKQAVIQELEEQGIVFDALYDEVGRDIDPFDLICHTAFDMPPLTRKERSENVKKRNYFAKYGKQTRKVLESLLDKYADEGIENIETMEVLKLNPIKQLGSPIEIVKWFGGKDDYEEAVKELGEELYKSA